VGAGCALGAAVAFGVTVVTQRELATRGLSVTTALGVRFSIAALLLLGFLAGTGRPVRPAAGERAGVAVLGVVGYAGEAGLFYAALQRGSAGAVALLFYAYPALVALLEAASGRRPFTRRSAGALLVSTLGTALVVAAGAAVTITSAGVVLALGSAAAFSVYLVASDVVVRRTPSSTAAAWVAAGAGLVLLVAGVATGSLSVPQGAWPLLALNGGATALAFGLLYAALPRLGAGPTAVVMTLEAFVSVGLAALLLDERILPLQAVGGVGIIAATVLVASNASGAVRTSGPTAPDEVSEESYGLYS
jgi:drug/metabolite transporter (DMT)-like permease